MDGWPRIWLRLEGGAVFLLATLIYAIAGHGWWLFLALFFVPDVSFAAYLLGRGAGALGYNLLHSYLLPLALLPLTRMHVDVLLPGLSGLNLTPAMQAVPLVWIAHIGFDRMLGYGLKYPSGFKDTHLGRL